MKASMQMPSWSILEDSPMLKQPKISENLSHYRQPILIFKVERSVSSLAERLTRQF